MLSSSGHPFWPPPSADHTYAKDSTATMVSGRRPVYEVQGVTLTRKNVKSHVFGNNYDNIRTDRERPEKNLSSIWLKMIAIWDISPACQELPCCGAFSTWLCVQMAISHTGEGLAPRKGAANEWDGPWKNCMNISWHSSGFDLAWFRTCRFIVWGSMFNGMQGIHNVDKPATQNTKTWPPMARPCKCAGIYATRF